MSKRERMTLISLRLPAALLKDLDKIAKRRGVLRSEVIRQAVNNFIKDTSGK